MLTERERETIEREMHLSAQTPADAISEAVGEHVFSRNHRFPDLRALAWMDASVVASGLVVSRFYFSAKPPVIVDVVPQPARARAVIAAKRAYCKRNGFRYVLVEDAYDDHGVRTQLAATKVPATSSEPPAAPARKPAAQKRPRTRATAARR